MMRLPFLCAVFASAITGIARCQLPVIRLRLVRCAPTSDAPCVSAAVELGSAERAAAARLDSSAESTAWRGRLGAMPLVGAGVSRPRSVIRPVRLLVVVDRGADMAGERTAFTRIALKSWIATLDSASVKIAVAAFGGSDATHAVDAAAMGSVAAAVAAVDRLPPPETKAASPLYDAVVRAAQRIDRELRATPGSEGGVLVITAGRNQVGGAGAASSVRSGGSAGLAAASAAIQTANRRIWLIALGPDELGEELRTLAGTLGVIAVIPVDPNALSNQLNRVARDLPQPRQLVFGLGTTEPAFLGRSTLFGTAELGVGNGARAAHALFWRPPLVAMPTFQGVADSGALSSDLKEVLLVGGNGTDRSLIAFLLALVVVSIWWLVPRLVWVDHDTQAAVSHESTPRPNDTTVPGAPESAPRKPEDITHQTARRTAMHR
jgi:Mg-chelatase subunit ChlD